MHYNETYVDMVEKGILDPAKGYKKCSSERNKCCFYTSYNRVMLYLQLKRKHGYASRRLQVEWE